jgi:hypothetical protein
MSAWLTRLAERLAERGMSGPAQRCVRAALRVGRGSRADLSRLLEVTRRIDDPRLAVEVARRLVELEADNPDARGTLATLLLLVGEVDAAAAEAARVGSLLAPGIAAPRVVRDALLDPERARRGEAYVTWLDDVLVETAFWSIVKGDQVFNLEVHGRGLAASPYIEGRVAPDGAAYLMRCPQPTIRIDEPCAFLGGDENYSHWVNRNLLKLALIEDDDEYARLPLLVNDDLRPYQHEYLEMLGIDPKRLIRVPRNTAVACRRVAVPTLLRNHPRMWVGTDWIRRRLAGSCSWRGATRFGASSSTSRSSRTRFRRTDSGSSCPACSRPGSRSKHSRRRTSSSPRTARLSRTWSSRPREHSSSSLPAPRSCTCPRFAT